jgi:SMI1-KNR4 cell-wall
MKIKLKNGKCASEVALHALETALFCRLSESFRAFSLSNDGAEPETNIFRISDRNESGVNRFIPVNEIPKERAFIENLPERAYPIAWAEGGNYVFINEDQGGAVFFWDHENPNQITKLEADFGAFLDVLEPFDIKSVQLKSGQVKKVWVNPDFIKKLKK